MHHKVFGSAGLYANHNTFGCAESRCVVVCIEASASQSLQLNPMRITIFISQPIRSIHKPLQYDDGVCMTAAVLAVTVVVVS